MPAGQSQRFCAACGAPLAAPGDSATVAGPPVRPGLLKQRADTPSSGQFLPGVVIGGRYRMVGLIGRGGMGEVYRADDLKLGQPVALKFLPADVERDPERLDRFLTEVRMSLRVTHPNVCRVWAFKQFSNGDSLLCRPSIVASVAVDRHPRRCATILIRTWGVLA